MSGDFPSSVEIKALAEDNGYIERREEASYTLFFKENTKQTYPTLINIFYTTRGVMTKLAHPTQGYNSLWRADAYDSLEALAELFANPRTHTGKGFRQAKDAVRGCTRCGLQKKRECFSRNQWKLDRDKIACKDCIEGKSNSTPKHDEGADKPITNLHEIMDQKSKNALERRQFNCPLCPEEGRGKNVFFKRVPVDKPIVKCPQCKKVKQGDCDRLYPIPKGEEKGYGFFRCHFCNTAWGSSRSIANIGQQCQVCQIDGKPSNFIKPFRIEVPRLRKGRGIVGGGARPAGRHMRRVPRESIPENEPESVPYSSEDGERFSTDVKNGLGERRGTGVGRSFDFKPANNKEDTPVETPSSSYTPLQPRSKFVHKCEGCTTGICRSRKLPISGVHDNTGDTVSTNGSVMTNSIIDNLEFRDIDADFDDWDEDDGSIWVTVGYNGKVLKN